MVNADQMEKVEKMDNATPEVLSGRREPMVICGIGSQERGTEPYYDARYCGCFTANHKI